MSSAAMKWARRQKLANGRLSRALDVLAMLANEAKGNSLFHSQQTIAGRLHCSVRTVCHMLADLETLGLIQRAHRGRRDGRGRTSDLIRLRLDQDFDLTREQVAETLSHAKSARNSVTTNTQVLHDLHAGSAHDQLVDQLKVEISAQENLELSYQSAQRAAPEKPSLRVVNGGRP